MLPPLGKFSDLRRTIIQKHGSICLYVAKHDAPLLNILFQGGGSAEFIDLEGFHLELVPPDYVWDTVKYTLTYGEFTSRINVMGIDSVPCGSESNVDFVHFVWDNIEQFSYTRYSINILPPHDDPNSRPQTLYLAHHRGESDGWRHQNGCILCRSDYLEIVRPLTYYCTFPPVPVNAPSADGNPSPSQLLPLISCFDSHSTWNCLNCQQTLHTISTLRRQVR